MSNTATQTAFSGFAPAVVEQQELPRLNCLGYVGEVGEAKLTSKGVYYMQPFTIEPTQGGKKGFVNLLYQPNWLRPGFNPESLKAEEGGDTLFIVYKMHISGSNQLSTLAGLAGSEENFHQLAARIQSAIEGVEDEAVPSVIEGVFREFFQELNPKLGYYSSQKKEDTGEVVNGRKVKAAVPGKREINGYFWPSEDSDKRNLASAAKGTSVMAYDAS